MFGRETGHDLGSAEFDTDLTPAWRAWVSIAGAQRNGQVWREEFGGSVRSSRDEC